MALRTIGSLFIFLGFSLLCGALGWWGAFYGDVVLESGFANPDPSVLLPCLYNKLGTCGFATELSHYAYSATALWAAFGVFAIGVILRGAPRRERTLEPRIVPSEGLAIGDPALATQLNAAEREIKPQPIQQPIQQTAARAKVPVRQMRAPSSPYPPKAALNRHGAGRGIAAENYAYMDTGRSNLGVIGLGVLAAAGAMIGLQASFSTFEGINEPSNALSAHAPAVGLADFPKPIAVLTRGQIFRDLQFSARGEVIGADQAYFTTLTSSQVAVIDSPSGDYRGLLEINDKRVPQFVVIRRSDDEIVLARELRGQGAIYDPALAYSPSEDSILLRAIEPRGGHALVVINLATGERHTIAQPVFPQPKKAAPDQRNSWIFLETLRWQSPEEVQYLAAFECLQPSEKKKMKCEPGEIELFVIRAQTTGAVIEAKKVAAMAKPANVALESFVTDQFRLRLQAYSAALNDGSDKDGADLERLTDSLALFAEKHALDASNPFSQDVVLALFQDSPE